MGIPKALPSEAIIYATWNDMKMHVRNFLPGIFPVRQKQIDSTAARQFQLLDTRKVLRGRKNGRCFLRFQFSEGTDMPYRANKSMAGINRI